MNLSKTKYCEAVQCNKYLWLNEYKPNEKIDLENDSVLENGTEVGERAKDLFGFHVDVLFDEDLNIMLKRTEDLIKVNNIIITEASFKYKNNFCSVDILKKEKNELELYEVKSSTEINDIYIDDISYQYYILSNLNYKIKKACIVYLNSNYERKGNLNLKELFNIEDVTEKVISKQNNVKEKIDEVNLLDKEPNIDIDNHCFKPYQCPFFKYCTKHFPEKNIFNVRIMRNSSKIKLYKEGIYTYEDLLKQDIDFKYKQQIDFELNNKEPYIEKDKIKSFLDTLSYPLYFLDFETFQQAIPKYDRIRPYMQIPFQYSLHYIENGILKHKEFLSESGIDPRRTLALSLINDIPKDVCVLAYNMSFEKSVIKNLSILFPDLKDHLMNIYNNIKDLMIPFKEHYYYTKEMEGSYSIKYVLPALFKEDSSLNYHNLENIHNGSEAMNAFVNLEKLPKEEQNIIRNSLLKYCELDTYAMVRIWEKLQDVIK
jgi:hypothetical protein